MADPVAELTHVDTDIEVVGAGGAATEKLTFGSLSFVQPSSQALPAPSSSMSKVVLLDLPSGRFAILDMERNEHLDGGGRRGGRGWKLTLRMARLCRP